ncbi:MAG: hypothetical protein BGN89_02375 [Alphaproteobacteria bacterium 64-6]|nr:MAG: hypothetical protein BGN89_02375 [Alphaproteobacteria bacterium 64-6]
MILYTLAIAFLIGLVRWRVWTVPLLTVAAVVVNIGVVANWNFEVWRPFNNPIFIDLVLKLLLVNFIASVIGYGVGRLIAFIMGYLARNFRTPIE